MLEENTVEIAQSTKTASHGNICYGNIAFGQHIKAFADAGVVKTGGERNADVFAKKFTQIRIADIAIFGGILKSDAFVEVFGDEKGGFAANVVKLHLVSLGGF